MKPISGARRTSCAGKLRDRTTRTTDLSPCSPPYQTRLDRAALDGRLFDDAPLDVHVGSIAVRRFIEQRQPLVTLHGHVHESARLTGSWQEKIGRTHCFSAAHDGPELALVRFNPENPAGALRAPAGSPKTTTGSFRGSGRAASVMAPIFTA